MQESAERVVEMPPPGSPRAGPPIAYAAGALDYASTMRPPTDHAAGADGADAADGAEEDDAHEPRRRRWSPLPRGGRVIFRRAQLGLLQKLQDFVLGPAAPPR